MIKKQIIRYKDDGTRSYQRIFLTKNLLEINCRKENTQYVKPKWRLPIQKIAEIRDNYKTNPKLYNESAFEKMVWYSKAKYFLKFKGSILLLIMNYIFKISN